MRRLFIKPPYLSLISFYLWFFGFIFSAVAGDPNPGANAPITELTPKFTVMAPLRLSGFWQPDSHLRTQLTHVREVPAIPFFHIYDVVRTDGQLTRRVYDSPLGERIREVLRREEAVIVIGPQDRFRHFDEPQHPRAEELQLMTLSEFEEKFGVVHFTVWEKYFKWFEDRPMKGGVRLAGEVLFHFKTVDEAGRPILILVLDGIPYDNHETIAAAKTQEVTGKLLHRGSVSLIKHKADVERDGAVAYQVQRIELSKLPPELAQDLQDHLNIHRLNRVPLEAISHPFTIYDTELFALMTLGQGDVPYHFQRYLQGLSVALKSWPTRLFNQTMRPRDQYVFSPAVLWKLFFVGGLATHWAYHNPDAAWPVGVVGAGLFAGGEAVMNMMYTTTSRSFFSKPNTLFYIYMATFLRSMAYGFMAKSIQYWDPAHVLTDQTLLWHVFTHSLITTAAKFYFTRLNKEMQEVAQLGSDYEINRVNNDIASGWNSWVTRWPKFLQGAALPDDAIRRATRRQTTYEVFYDVLKQGDLFFGENSPVARALIRTTLMATGVVWAYLYYALEMLTTKGKMGLADQVTPQSRWYQVMWLTGRNSHRVVGHFFRDAIYDDLIMKTGRSALQKLHPGLARIHCDRK